MYPKLFIFTLTARLRRRNLDPFALKQQAFPMQATGKSPDLFVRREHPMTRNQNRNRVGAASAADRPASLGFADGRSYFPVA